MKKKYIQPVSAGESLWAEMDMMQMLDVSNTNTSSQYVNVRDDAEYSDLDSLLVGSTNGWEESLWEEGLW